MYNKDYTLNSIKRFAVCVLALSLTFNTNYFKVSANAPEKVVESTVEANKIGFIEGNYDIVSGEQSLELINNVIKVSKGDKQSFEFKKTNNEAYIIELPSGNVLSGNVVNVKQEKLLNKSNQHWIIKEVDGKFLIQNKETYNYLTIIDGEVKISGGEFLWNLNKSIPKPLPKGKFVYFGQNDSKWGNTKYSWMNVRNAGCSPVALTMVINYIDAKEITPPEIIDIAKKNKLDILASPRTNTPELLKILEKTYDFGYKTITKDKVVSELKNGNMVVIATKRNLKIKYKNQGHYLVLKGIDKNGKIIVNDPYVNNTYGEKADSSVLDHDKKYVYVATPEDLLAEVFESYSFFAK